MSEKFNCPECGSNNIKLKFKTNKNTNNYVYSNIDEEIQCGSCFYDIPSILGLENFQISIEEQRNDWINIFKPEHLKLAAKCSKCDQYYWEIEIKLEEKDLNTGDIFYQSYNVDGTGGKLVCKLCDPKSFK